MEIGLLYLPVHFSFYNFRCTNILRGLLNVSIDLVVICLTSAERTYTVAFCWANEHDA